MAHRFILRPSFSFGYVFRTIRCPFATAASNNHIPKHSVSFDMFENGIRSTPEASQIVRILKNAPADAVNSAGLLQTLGQAFVKYAVTLNLYMNNDSGLDTKWLHDQRKQQLRVLKQVMEDKDALIPLKKYFVAPALQRRFEALDIPQAQWNLAMLENIHEMSDDEVRQLAQWKQNLADENVQRGDRVALIGAYLTERGARSALLIAEWLGCKVLPTDILRYANNAAYALRFGEWKKPVVKTLHEDADWMNTLEDLLFGYNELENKIGYKFQNRLLLLEAVSHHSFAATNKLTRSNEQLAFLGDSILSFLMAAYTFQNAADFTPERSEDFCNIVGTNLCVGNAVVRTGLHSYFRHMDNKISYTIKSFYEFRKKKKFAIEREAFLQYTRDNKVMAIRSAYQLGDYFEAILAAVFLDSNSFESTWNVVTRIMGPEIDFHANSKTPSLYHRLESLGKSFSIGEAIKVPDTRLWQVTIDIDELGQFEGFGREQKGAKHAAILNALKAAKRRSYR